MDRFVVMDMIQPVRYRSDVFQVQDTRVRVRSHRVIDKINLERAQPQRGTRVP